MTLDKMIEALQIVAKYCNDPSKEWCSAEHDVLYLPLEISAAIDAADEARLEQLGAFKSSESDCWTIFT